VSLRARSPAGRGATWVWGGFALGCGAGFAGSVTPALMLPLGLGAAGGGLVVMAIGRRRALPVAVVGAVVLGLLRSSFAVAVPGPATIDGNFGTLAVVLTGVVRTADPGAGSDAIVDVSHLADTDTDRAVSGGVLVSGPLIPALSPGDKVEIDASGLRPLERRPGANAADTLEREGVQGIATSPQVFVLASAGLSVASLIGWVQTRLISAVDAELPEPGAALMLGLSPALVEDPGFQLSFLGTAGILLLATPIAARLPGPRLFVEPFALTVAAQVATLPIMAGTFGVIALGGPIANALVLPLLPAMIVGGGLGATMSALHPGLGWILLQVASLGTSLTTSVARIVSAIPVAAIQVGSWPEAWSIAEACGLLAVLAVLATARRGFRELQA
jgi:hypothetical protein